MESNKSILSEGEESFLFSLVDGETDRLENLRRSVEIIENGKRRVEELIAFFDNVDQMKAMERSFGVIDQELRLLRELKESFKNKQSRKIYRPISCDKDMVKRAYVMALKSARDAEANGMEADPIELTIKDALYKQLALVVVQRGEHYYCPVCGTELDARDEKVLSCKYCTQRINWGPRDRLRPVEVLDGTGSCSDTEIFNDQNTVIEGSLDILPKEDILDEVDEICKLAKLTEKESVVIESCVDALKSDSSCVLVDIKNRTGISISTIRRAFNKLHNIGIVEKSGEGTYRFIKNIHCTKEEAHEIVPEESPVISCGPADVSTPNLKEPTFVLNGISFDQKKQLIDEFKKYTRLEKRILNRIKECLDNCVDTDPCIAAADIVKNNLVSRWKVNEVITRLSDKGVCKVAQGKAPGIYLFDRDKCNTYIGTVIAYDIGFHIYEKVESVRLLLKIRSIDPNAIFREFVIHDFDISLRSVNRVLASENVGELHSYISEQKRKAMEERCSQFSEVSDRDGVFCENGLLMDIIRDIGPVDEHDKEELKKLKRGNLLDVDFDALCVIASYSGIDLIEVTRCFVKDARSQCAVDHNVVSKKITT